MIASVSPDWTRYRIRGGVALAVIVVAVLVLAVVRFAQHGMEAGLRHAELLGEVAELRAVVVQYQRDGERYLRDAPRTYPDYERDRRIYYARLQDDLDRIGERIAQLARVPAGEGVPTTVEPVASDFAALRDFWQIYRQGLAERIGEDREQPRLEWAAEYLVEHGEALQSHIDAAIRRLENAIHDQRQQVTIGAGWGMALVLLVLALGFVLPGRLLVRRIGSTLAACERIAEGDFGFRADPDRDEFTQLQQALGHVSARLSTSLGLVDSVHHGHNLEQVLGQLRQSLSAIWPLDWVGLYRAESGAEFATLAEQSPALEDAPLALKAGELDSAAPYLALRDGPLPAWLAQLGMAGTAVLPIPLRFGASFRLVMASRQSEALPQEDARLLVTLAPLIANGLEKSVLAEQLLLAAVDGLSQLAEQRDPETGEHLLRMSRYAEAIAEDLRQHQHPEALAESPGWVRDIRHFAPMHDIGKVGIADSILRKESALTEVEREQMQRHPLIGGKVLRTCAQQLPPGSRHLFDIAIEIAEGHHERYDGRGYPYGRRATDIPLSARIVALADVFDALTSKRPYKEAWSIERALDYVDQSSGSHFDPAVVAALRRSMPEVLAIYQAHKHV
ncbi:MAG: HD domain-containing phosphohydrolase [Lysobacterales bacterium]